MEKLKNLYFTLLIVLFSIIAVIILTVFKENMSNTNFVKISVVLNFLAFVMIQTYSLFLIEKNKFPLSMLYKSYPVAFFSFSILLVFILLSKENSTTWIHLLLCPMVVQNLYIEFFDIRKKLSENAPDCK